MFIIKKIKNKKGFTLIEGLVALFVFSILVVVFYKVFTQTTIHMQNSKYRRGAVALANERMEQFRNLAYENVATKANAPVGDIEDDENVVINGLNYRIISSVFFVDDPTDGLFEDGDSKFEDYKRVSVTILWGEAVSDTVTKADALQDTKYESKRISLVSQFVPPGGLEVMPTGGILSINVLDTGVEPVVPVSGATVLITDNECGTGAPHPECDSSILMGTTDSTGNYMYIGAPICTGCYEISVTKEDYEARDTKDPFIGDDGDSDPYEEGEYEPTYAHQGVSAGDITTISFNTNKISQLNIVSYDAVDTVDPDDRLIPSVQFDIYGGFILGTTVGGNVSNVYDYSATDQETDATDADIDIYSMYDASNCTSSTDPCYASTGVYMIDFDLDDDGIDDAIPTGYTFWKMTPNDEIDAHSVSVVADTDVEAKMIFLKDDYDGAWIRVVETINSEQIPVVDASVQLERTDAPTYDVTLTTDEFGYVYFPEDTSSPLVNGETYDITVNADDYDEETDTITVDELTTKDITITLSS
jgi:prepilin-type N-terminal cleavage/methylation domain-containing protein